MQTSKTLLHNENKIKIYTSGQKDISIKPKKSLFNFLKKKSSNELDLANSMISSQDFDNLVSKIILEDLFEGDNNAEYHLYDNYKLPNKAQTKFSLFIDIDPNTDLNHFKSKFRDFTFRGEPLEIINYQYRDEQNQEKTGKYTFVKFEKNSLFAYGIKSNDTPSEAQISGFFDSIQKNFLSKDIFNKIYYNCDSGKYSSILANKHVQALSEEKKFSDKVEASYTKSINTNKVKQQDNQQDGKISILRTQEENLNRKQFIKIIEPSSSRNSKLNHDPKTSTICI